MSIGFRHFLFDARGDVRRISNKLMDELIDGKNALPEYAGQSLRLFDATVEIENKKPVKLSNTSGSIVHFDENGKADRHFRQTAMLAGENLPDLTPLDDAKDKKVVSLAKRLSQKQWQDEHQWEPTPKEINLVIGLIWPNETGGVKPKSSRVTPAKKTKPPLTREARNAVREIASHALHIHLQIDRLKEKSLVGLIADCEEQAQDDPEFPSLWQGAAVAAEHRLQVLQARRTKKGTWYAVVEATVYEDSSSEIGDLTEIEWTKCNGRDAAITAVRALLRKHVDLVNDRTSIEPRLYPEIEWTPPR